MVQAKKHFMDQHMTPKLSDDKTSFGYTIKTVTTAQETFENIPNSPKKVVVIHFRKKNVQNTTRTQPRFENIHDTFNSNNVEVLPYRTRNAQKTMCLKKDQKFSKTNFEYDSPSTNMKTIYGSPSSNSQKKLVPITVTQPPAAWYDRRPESFAEYALQIKKWLCLNDGHEAKAVDDY